MLARWLLFDRLLLFHQWHSCVVQVYFMLSLISRLLKKQHWGWTYWARYHGSCFNFIVSVNPDKLPLLWAHRVFCLSNVQHLDQSILDLLKIATDDIEAISDKAAGVANSFDIQLAEPSIIDFLRPQIVGKHSFVCVVAILFVALTSCEVDELSMVVRCASLRNVFEKWFHLAFDYLVKIMEVWVLCNCSMPSISFFESEQVRFHLQD